ESAAETGFPLSLTIFTFLPAPSAFLMHGPFVAAHLTAPVALSIPRSVRLSAATSARSLTFCFTRSMIWAFALGGQPASIKPRTTTTGAVARRKRTADAGDLYII